MAKPKPQTLLSLGDTHQITADSLQWILQRKLPGGTWANEAYCRTKLGLNLRLKPYGLTMPNDWPEQFSSWLKARELAVAH